LDKREREGKEKEGEKRGGDLLFFLILLVCLFDLLDPSADPPR